MGPGHMGSLYLLSVATNLKLLWKNKAYLKYMYICACEARAVSTDGPHVAVRESGDPDDV